MKNDNLSFWFPTREYGAIDAINRSALATGSTRGASAGAGADYNGHGVRISYNGIRRYWVAEYTWAGRHVIGRGSLDDCLAAAARDFNRGALGAVVIASHSDRSPETAEEFAAACDAVGMVEHTDTAEEAHRGTWAWQARGGAAEAIRWHRSHGVPTSLFLDAASLQAWQNTRRAFLADQRTGRR
tara:strand:- start:35 stop:589 length:555 start_codon:yes stop_codon:yes gene_type:complete